MKAVVATFNQENALVGAFSVLTNLRMELFEALDRTHRHGPVLSLHTAQGRAHVRHRQEEGQEHAAGGQSGGQYRGQEVGLVT